MNRNCYTLPYDKMRYETGGDYFFVAKDEMIEFNVVNLNDEGMELLILIHEIIEEYLTRKNKVTEEEIMKFDLIFEENRKEGDYDEPGFDKNCPYRKEHTIATKIEKYIAKQLKINWKEYDKKIMSLEK